MAPGSIVRFGGFTLNEPRRCLYGPDGAELKLRPKSFDLLCHLVAQRGRVVSKEELVAAVWPDVVVTDDSVFQCVRDVRCVLGDEAQQIIRTVSRRGYLFAADVVSDDAAPSAPAAPAPEIDGRSLGPVRGRSAEIRAAIAGAAVLAVLGIAAWTIDRQPGPRPGAGLRIAVLPFEPLEQSTERHFGDGIAEDMIAALSRFRDLTDVAGNSSLRYRGEINPAQAAKALDAAFIVRGSVARHHDRIRVNVHLVDAQSGATRWAERYERPLKSMFELQDDIADQVAARLVGHAHYHAAERIRARPPSALEAYELVLRARQGFNAFTAASLADASALLQRATSIDPGYAPAWDLLGRVLIRQYLHPGELQYLPQTLQQARDALQTALSLDATLATSHGALGYAHLLQRQYDASLAALRHSIPLNPNDAGNFRAYGDALFLVGEQRAAIDAYRRSRQLDPFSPPQVAALMGRAHLMLADYEQARALARECLDRAPTVPMCLTLLAAASAAAGHRDEAGAATKLLLERYPATSIGGTARVFAFRAAADQARWSEYLRAAGIPE